MTACNEHLQYLKKLHTTLSSNQTLLRIRPELRLYEILVKEIANFVPPEESLRVEFTKALAHPSLVLNVVPEKFSERQDSGGIPE